jgi:putative MATE family efflux protein
LRINPSNKLILSLAIPAILQTVIRSSFSILDAYWIGKTGSTELASLTVATFLFWGTMSLGEMISNGTNSLVAQSTGAKNKLLSRNISRTNIVNTCIHSLILGALIIPALPYLYSIIKLDKIQASLSSEYLVTILIGLPCITLLSTVTAIFRGYGNTKTPFYLVALAVILNFFLTPLLIFGTDISGLTTGSNFLKLGMRGAALGTLISYLTAAITGIIILKRKELIDALTKYRFNFRILKETVKIGFPLSMNGVAFSLIYVFISRFVADYGTTGLAALGIGHRSESIAFQICVGFSLSATILIGQSVGAGEYKLAEKYAYKILFLSTLINLIFSFILFFYSAETAAIFTNDIDVISATSTYNKIAAIVLIFTSAEVVFTGAFAGAGDSLPPSIISLSMNILRIPLCIILTPLYGLAGIWIAIGISVLIKGIALPLWFRKGKWKDKKSKLLESRPDNVTSLPLKNLFDLE